MGAAEGAMGDRGGSSLEEAVGECPPPRPAAEETQATLPVPLQKPCMLHSTSKRPYRWKFCIQPI